MLNEEKTTKEIFVDGVWVPYDSRGEDTEKSREFYKQCGETPFIQGSFPVRINGVVQSGNPPNRVYYRKNSRHE